MTTERYYTKGSSSGYRCHFDLKIQEPWLQTRPQLQRYPQSMLSYSRLKWELHELYQLSLQPMWRWGAAGDMQGEGEVLAISLCPYMASDDLRGGGGSFFPSIYKRSEKISTCSSNRAFGYLTFWFCCQCGPWQLSVLFVSQKQK